MRNVARLGPLEPLAFLHAWRDVLEDPEHDHIDPSFHGREQPTHDQTRMFLEEHRTELVNLAEYFGAPC